MTAESGSDEEDHDDSVTQDAGRDNWYAEGDSWYFDMRGAVVGLDTRKPLDELVQDLDHFREYLEEKKREWVRESILKDGGKGLFAAHYTDMKLIRAQLESCKSAIIGRRGRPVASPQDIEWPRQAFDRLKTEFLIERRQRQDSALLSRISWKTRTAVFGADKFVVILHNETGDQLKFYLRGHRIDGSYKDLPLAIDAGKKQEIGRLEGWDGNWSKGERFEVWTYHDSIISWSARID